MKSIRRNRRPHLFLVRHGASVWNLLGLWTGWQDIGLAPQGREEARRVGQALRHFAIHSVHVSALRRTHETLYEIQKTLAQEFSVHISASLNERNYGVYTGKNKWQIQKEIGAEAFKELRRGWNTVIPGGETLEAVSTRMVTYYENHIIPELLAGKTVLIVSHGNTLRALVKYLENIPDDKIKSVEIAYAEIITYRLEGKRLRRETPN